MGTQYVTFALTGINTPYITFVFLMSIILFDP